MQIIYKHIIIIYAHGYRMKDKIYIVVENAIIQYNKELIKILQYIHLFSYVYGHMDVDMYVGLKLHY